MSPVGAISLMAFSVTYAPDWNRLFDAVMAISDLPLITGTPVAPEAGVELRIVRGGLIVVNVYSTVL